mgnify:CR=1 FL=1
MSLCLTHDELRELSGYDRPRWQIEWLRTRQWPHELDKDGRPRVLRATMLARLGASNDTPQTPRLRLP